MDEIEVRLECVRLVLENVELGENATCRDAVFFAHELEKYVLDGFEPVRRLPPGTGENGDVGC